MSIDVVQVRLYLKELGWTETRLANEASLSQPMINAFLNGKRKLSDASSGRILAALLAGPMANEGATTSRKPIHAGLESALERIAAALEQIAKNGQP